MFLSRRDDLLSGVITVREAKFDQILNQERDPSNSSMIASGRRKKEQEAPFPRMASNNSDISRFKHADNTKC